MYLDFSTLQSVAEILACYAVAWLVGLLIAARLDAHVEGES